MNISESETKLILLVGTFIVTTMVSVVTVIKQWWEIKKIKVEFAVLVRNTSAQDPRIYIPRGAEERIRRGSKKIFRMLVIATGSGVISFACASTAIPIARAQLQSDAAEKTRLELKITEQKKETERLQERLKEAETAYFRDVNAALVPRIPVAPVPSPKPALTAAPSADLDTSFFHVLRNNMVSANLYERAADINATLLRRIHSGDYDGFLRLIHPLVRHKFTLAEFRSIKAKIPTGFSPPKYDDLLGATHDHELGLYVWRLKPEKSGPVIIETLAITDGRVTFLSLHVHEFPPKREAQ